MTIASEPVITNADLTQAEIEKARDYLAETRDSMLAAVAGLSPEQWTFKPGPDRWSIAETLEHVAMIEGRVHMRISGMSEAPAVAAGVNPAEVEERIQREIPSRSARVQAPPAVLPTNACSGPQAVEQFVQGRKTTLQLLSAPHLRGHVQPHPFFGPWDGYQWLLAAAAHSLRHTGQILEVKSAPGFPV